MPDYSITPPPSSNRTCGLPASGSHASSHRKCCAVKLQSQRGNALKQPVSEHPSLRSGILIQAGFPSSYSSTLAFRHLRSTVVTRFLATMSLSDSRSQPRCGYVFPHPVGGSPTTEPGLPGSSTDLSTRAVPCHPGKSDECTRPLLLRRWQASASWAEWPLPTSVARPKWVRLRYGSGVRRTRLRTTNCSTPAADWLPAERAIYRMNTSRFTRSAKPGLTHPRRNGRAKKICFSLRCLFAASLRLARGPRKSQPRLASAAILQCITQRPAGFREICDSN